MQAIYAAVRAEADPERGWHLWHEKRSALYRDHPATPLAQAVNFTAIPVSPYDPAWCFAVDLEPHDGEALRYDLGADGAMHARPIARTIGLKDVLQQELTLYFLEGYGGGAFLPFADTAPTSYPGGRYLVDAIKGQDLGLDADNRLILDFNFAVTPSCAWNPAYVCPLAPPANRLKVPVSAGELRP